MSDTQPTSKELVTRLRTWPLGEIGKQAADEIERLQQRVKVQSETMQGDAEIIHRLRGELDAPANEPETALDCRALADRLRKVGGVIRKTYEWQAGELEVIAEDLDGLSTAQPPIAAEPFDEAYEEKLFSHWFEEMRRKDFAEAYPGEKFRPAWSMGMQSTYYKAWMARARLVPTKEAGR